MELQETSRDSGYMNCLCLCIFWVEDPTTPCQVKILTNPWLINSSTAEQWRNSLCNTILTPGRRISWSWEERRPLIGTCLIKGWFSSSCGRIRSGRLGFRALLDRRGSRAGTALVRAQSRGQLCAHSVQSWDGVCHFNDGCAELPAMAAEFSGSGDGGELPIAACFSSATLIGSYLRQWP